MAALSSSFAYVSGMSLAGVTAASDVLKKKTKKSLTGIQLKSVQSEYTVLDWEWVERPPNSQLFQGF